MAPKVWLITGCTSGFGHEIATAALARGDTVVATARNTTNLSTLASLGALTFEIDVTSPDATLASTISNIIAQTKTIDILVNNAGYFFYGGIEEASADEVQQLFATNVFGQLAMIRAVMPYMRAQRSGVVANLGSIGGYHGNGSAGLYCATKACATLAAEALRQEVAHLGIKVTAVEPGYFRTDIARGKSVTAKRVVDDVEPPTLQVKQFAETMQLPGDVVKGARVIVEALTATGRFEGVELPVRLPIGSDAYRNIKTYTGDVVREMEIHKTAIVSTDHDDVHST